MRHDRRRADPLQRRADVRPREHDAAARRRGPAGRSRRRGRDRSRPRAARRAAWLRHLERSGPRTPPPAAGPRLSPEYFLTTGRGPCGRPRATRHRRGVRTSSSTRRWSWRARSSRRSPAPTTSSTASACCRRVGSGSASRPSSTSWLAAPGGRRPFDAGAGDVPAHQPAVAAARGDRRRGTTSASSGPRSERRATHDRLPMGLDDFVRRPGAADRAPHARHRVPRDARGAGGRHRGPARAAHPARRDDRSRGRAGDVRTAARRTSGSSSTSPTACSSSTATSSCRTPAPGIMFGALANGLPQLLLPQGADQFANADACRDAGVALTLAPDEVTADGGRRWPCGACWSRRRSGPTRSADPPRAGGHAGPGRRPRRPRRRRHRCRVADEHRAQNGRTSAHTDAFGRPAGSYRRPWTVHPRRRSRSRSCSCSPSRSAARPSTRCAAPSPTCSTRTGATSARCDIRALQRPGVGAAGVLARLRLVAREMDRSFVVVRAPRRFVVLLDVLGLCEAVPCVTEREERDPFAPGPGSTW